MENRGEIVGEDSIRGIVNNFSKVIDEMNKSTIRTHGNDDIDDFFDVSLTTLKEIDKFTKDLELGKYAVWSEMTSDKREEVLDNITTKWNAIVVDLESKPKDTPIADDNMSNEGSPNDPIVQSVYIHKKPSSYVVAMGGLKPNQVLIPTIVVTPNVHTPSVEKTNNGFQTVGKKKKKGKSKSTNVGQIGGHLVKPNVRLPLLLLRKVNLTMSNSYVALGDESDEDVENVYDESANLFRTKTVENSSTFTAAAG
ncbi:hypothetical protein Tco_0140751 [Tanacetum coccineum]